jgi:hypothetical protein
MLPFPLSPLRLLLLLLLLRRHQCRHNTVNRFTLVASLKKNDAVSRTSPPTNEFSIATILLGLAWLLSLSEIQQSFVRSMLTVLLDVALKSTFSSLLS